MVAVVATVTLASGVPAGAGRTDDQALADDAVLTLADVPSGFTGGPYETEGSADPPPECTKAMAKADRSVEQSPIARSQFQLESSSGTGSGYIQNTVAVMGSVGKAKKAMKAYASDEDAAEACFAAIFEQFFEAPGVTNEVSLGSFDPSLDDKGNEEVIDGGDDFLGYGGSVRRSAGGPSQFFEVQVVLARDGRVLTQLVLIATGAIPRDDATQMLQTVVDRMADA